MESEREKKERFQSNLIIGNHKIKVPENLCLGEESQ